MLDYLRIMLNARLAKMDERGASAVEYGLLIAGIAALIVAVVFAFGGVIQGVFTDTCDAGRRGRAPAPAADPHRSPMAAGGNPRACGHHPFRGHGSARAAGTARSP